MSDTQALVLLLALVYLSDCVAWVRRGAVAFRALGAGDFRAALPSAFTGNARAGLVWTNPLPPLGTLFVAESWPLAFSPDALASVPGLELDPRAPRVAQWHAKRWSEVGEIRAVEKELWIDGRVFARADTLHAARELARLADALRKAPAARREALIDAALAPGFDVEAVTARATSFAKATRALRIATNALFAFLAVVLPLMLWRFGILMTWPWLLAGLVACLATVAVLFWRAHRTLRPDAKSARRRALALIALSPPEAVRALDSLARPWLAGFDPLAAAALLGEDARRELVRSILLDTRHPLPPPVSAEPVAVDCERWFRARLLRERERAAQRLGLDPRSLLAPPASDDPSARGFCLRCELDHAEAAGACSDCGAELAARA
ncbi:MAG: hypothetical protein IT453_17720 [Planctomycetes bacterium]|nr:hypothetical protein [Planctomycetota bacterium]